MLRRLEAAGKHSQAALGHFDELQTEPQELIDAVGSSDLQLRRSAVESLGEIGDARAVAVLGRAMESQ